MTAVKELGHYLDRKVIFQTAESLDDLTMENVSNALVLLCLSQSWRDQDLAELIKRLATNRVLGITIAGTRVDVGFDTLLRTMSSIEIPMHVMTGIDRSNDLDEVISDFLLATYPDEQRFNDWTEYRIVFIGKPALAEKMRRAIQDKLLPLLTSGI